MMGQTNMPVEWYRDCCEKTTLTGLPTLVDMTFGANIFKIGFNIGLSSCGTVGKKEPCGAERKSVQFCSWPTVPQ